MLNRNLAASSVLLCVLGTAVSAQSQVLIAPRTISLDAAQKLASTAIEACRKGGYNVTVVVLDASGRTRVQLHDDKAGPHTIENANRKAYTSLTFRSNTIDFAKRQEGRPAPMLNNVTLGQGGVVIKAGNDIVGSVGVSGAPGGDKDQACAEAGIATIASGLTAN